MSCETDQNKIAQAAGPAGAIPRLASKFTHFACRRGQALLAPGRAIAAMVAGSIAHRRAEKEAAAEAGLRQIAGWLKDEQRQQAALELQETLTGRQISVANLKKMFGRAADYSRLTGDSWIVQGEAGLLVYDQAAGQCTLQAIEPRLGHEIALRNRLALYVSPAPEANAHEEMAGRLDRARRWLGDHQDELGLIGQQSLAALLTGSRLKAGLARAGGLKQAPLAQKLSYAGMVTGLLAATYLGWQQVKATKAQLNKIVASLKDPARKVAAIQLQKDYQGLELAEAALAGLVGGTPLPFYQDIGKVDGPLGVVYYDVPAEGRAVIRTILPALGQEMALQKGLEILKAERQPTPPLQVAPAREVNPSA